MEKPAMFFSSKNEPINFFDIVYEAQLLIENHNINANLYDELLMPQNSGKGYKQAIAIIRKYVNLIDIDNKY